MGDTRSKLIVLIGVLGISLSAIFSRMSGAPSIIVAMYRMALTAALMLPVVLIGHRAELMAVRPRDISLCTLSGVFLGCHFSTYFESLKHTGIAASTVLVNTEVLVVALALVCIYRERIPRAGIAGIALAFTGSVIIAGGGIGGGSEALFGDTLALTGALCSSMYTLIGRGERQRLSTSLYTFLVYAAAALTLLIVALISGTGLGGLGPRDWGAVIGMVVCCTLMGHSIFSWALGHVSASYVSMAKLGEPVCATLLGIVLFREVPGISEITGGLIVIAGIAMYLSVRDTGSPEA